MNQSIIIFFLLPLLFVETLDVYNHVQAHCALGYHVNVTCPCFPALQTLGLFGWRNGLWISDKIKNQKEKDPADSNSLLLWASKCKRVFYMSSEFAWVSQNERTCQFSHIFLSTWRIRHTKQITHRKLLQAHKFRENEEFPAHFL